MTNFNYTKWLKYLDRILNKYGLAPDEIIDLACGTGGITIGLAKHGCKVIGIDSSEDMLYVAKEKSLKNGLNINFICQSMENIDLPHSVDAMTCICDGFNYIIYPYKLCEVFEKIYSYLKPQGILIFDISSYYKLSSILGNRVMIDNDKEISLIWQNNFNSEDRICQMELTFFVRQGDIYKRFDEIHFQKAYYKSEIEEMLLKSGFSSVDSYQPLTFDQPKKRSHRIVFVARKS